jgi:regulator of sigma E protease
MDYLVIATQLVLSLSILVTLHEMGHFFPARWFGMRVDKFYLFFNPWFSVWKTQKGDTEYGLGWLPLGGYVKIAGMVDESMDTEQLSKEPQPWEFRSKPAYQRLIVMLGGVIVNFLLGFFILSMLVWVNGKEFLPAQNAIYGTHVSEAAQKLGLKEGDKIITVGNTPFTRFEDKFLLNEIIFKKARTITILREGENQSINLPDDCVSLLSSNKKGLISPRIPFIISELSADMPASKAGLQKGDSLVSLNGQNLPYYQDFVKELTKNKSVEVKIGFYRKDSLMELAIKTTENGKIGAGTKFLPTEAESFGFFASFGVGTNDGLDFLSKQLAAFGMMFSGEIKATESLGGFISIGKLFPDTWDWSRFWQMTAILSLILGFMNLLPIPALDGGHALFLLIEIIFRKPLPQKFLEYAQMAGILLLLTLMIFAQGLDIFRLFKG